MTVAPKPDFGGYATKAGLKCSDGRTITAEAFKHMDGQKVPLVWQHVHNEPGNVLGHALLHARDDGIYCEGFFNETEAGKNSKILVRHDDVKALSIFANQLVEKSKIVLHGMIREVSLVLAGANPGAFIDAVSLEHSDGAITELDDAAIISAGLAPTDLSHADSSTESDSTDEADKTVRDVFDTLDEEQKNVVLHMLSVALETNTSDVSHADENNSEGDNPDGDNSNDNHEGDLTHQEGTDTMTHNVFEKAGEAGGEQRSTLTHDQLSTLVADGQRLGSFKESVLLHADEYGITNIELLFPDAQAIDNRPEWITRRMEWVDRVMAGTRKLPFSKIKSLSADLTHDEARAKGYIKGNMKKEQFFAIAKRETGPKTFYKKQKLDRDDILDITEFDVVAWLWVEMNFMVREEFARAVLVGDGREVDDEDKIDEDKIRPIATDDPFYTDVITVPANVSGDAMIEAVVRGRENYKGAGNPTCFLTRSVLNDMLLLKDKMGRRLYRNRAELAAELEVSEIIEVPIMEDAKTDDGDLLMILVNLSDYSVGSTRGGELTKFEDFDIDWNQYKYLLEGRASGALTKHKTAQVVVRADGTLVTPIVPTFDPATGVVTIPTQTGVSYVDESTGDTLTAGAQTALANGDTLSVQAEPAAGYFFPHNTDADWDFTRPAA